jgi:hypothetical protein
MTESRVTMKEWFENKLAAELGLPRLYTMSIFCGIKETEKAVYAMLYTGYDRTGTYATRKCAWIPKSCIENIEELKMVDDYEDAVKAFTFAF